MSYYVPFCFKILEEEVVPFCQLGFEFPTPPTTQDSQLCLVNFYLTFRSQVNHISVSSLTSSSQISLNSLLTPHTFTMCFSFIFIHINLGMISVFLLYKLISTGTVPFSFSFFVPFWLTMDSNIQHKTWHIKYP